MARIRVFIKIPSDDAFELKAQALNNDPRLKAAGISALKFENDKQYIADGEFSPELPPPTAPEPVSSESGLDSAVGGRLRVVVRVLSEDAYELKAQALNNDPRLKEAGISALKFESDKQYIADGEFSPDVPPSEAPPPDKSKPQSGERLRVYLRVPREDAYNLISNYLNGDPRLKEAGITGVSLVKGGGVAAPPDQVSHQLPLEPVSTPVAKKKPSPLRGCLVWGLILGIILVAGVVFAAPGLLASPTATASPTPTAMIVATEPSKPTQAVTATHTPTAVITKTKTAVPTKTQTPTLEPVVSCVAPQEGTILQLLNCRYGPGAVYIYRVGASPGQTVQIMGRADTAKGTWIYVQIPFQTPPAKCWINADPQYSEYQGNVSCLESYYPEKAPLPRLTNSLIGSHHRMMYMPTAVATRSVFIGPFTHWELAIGQTEATPHTNLFISSRPGHAREERLSSRHRVII